MNRHLLTLGLATASLFAAPLALAQNANANPNATEHANAAAHAEQSSAMQDHANIQPATPAVPATPATPADPQQQTPAVPATPATPAEPAQPANKVTWSELDADHDGALSKTEAEPVDSLSAAFDDADADKDGSLTADEYKAYRTTNQESPARQP